MEKPPRMAESEEESIPLDKPRESASAETGCKFGLSESTQDKGKGKRREKRGKGDEKDAKTFVWEDDEVELLLTCTAEYKGEKCAKGTDWESVLWKYDDILERYKENLPSPKDALKMEKSFKHGKDISKEVVINKLKAVRQKYTEAVDDGRRSGYGRVVLHFFELCQKIWGGSPGTEPLPQGIETVQLNYEESSEAAKNFTVQSTTTDSSGLSTAQELGKNSEGEDGSDLVASRKRRYLLNQKLANYRHGRLKRKAFIDPELLSIAQEDLKLKRKCAEQMAKAEQDNQQSMAMLNSTMAKVAQSISTGFSPLERLVATNQAPYAMPLGHQTPVHHPIPFQHTTYQQFPSTMTGHLAQAPTPSQTAETSIDDSQWPPQQFWQPHNTDSP